MEAIEEYQTQSTIDNETPYVENSVTPVVTMEAPGFHNSNGVTETDDVASLSAPNAEDAAPKVLELEAPVDNTDAIGKEEILHADQNDKEESTDIQETTIVSSQETETISEVLEYEIEETVIESVCDSASDDKVTFKTEVLVETNDSNEELNLENSVSDQQNANNILSDLGQGIELSEVLRSSDTTENIENNNSARQELFNKEELLDILEGNDNNQYECENELLLNSDPETKKLIEAQIALNQLTRLKTDRSKVRRSHLRSSKSTDKSKHKKQVKQSKLQVLEKSVESIDQNTDQNITVDEKSEDDNSEKSLNDTSNQKGQSIVNTLVKDWEDDDHVEEDQSMNPKEESADSEKDSQTEKSQEPGKIEKGQGDGDITIVMDTNTDSDVANINKGEDDTQPQKRQSRVIKKKVIFDPDNPDTFTKGKVVNKNRESVTEKEPSPKKIKTEEKQRSKSKSPMPKLPWKKPPPKNMNKQNKRLSEVDKLLMDEGAVNMIYQLTPEAPKGRKNMRTKAEFIKKIQSSTPDGKEMKFRERKKEICKSEEEAKKILGGKQRMSLSSSVKSPSMCEDFEAHSADDSIIYRRHSSSSYSSTCMSPRRLSDVDTTAVQNTVCNSQQASESNKSIKADEQSSDFLEGLANAPTNEIIKKEDCLSIKEKLNNKLAQALNKRKRETSKEKSSKQKRVSRTDNKDNTYSYLTVNFDQNLAEISINKNGFTVTIDLLKELEHVLDIVDKRNDTSVTLLTSESGSLCSGLSLRQLLDNSMEKRTNYAYEIAESARSMLSSLRRHSKLVVTGVWGPCSDVALALVALSDVTVSSEDASFALSSGMKPPLPGVAVLTSRCGQISKALVHELVVFKRHLSASEALKGGLISRTVWPQNASDHIRNIAKDIASQPVQGVLLKKQILNLGNCGESAASFEASLEAERDLLVQYWTSVECQEVLKTFLSGS